MTRYQAGAIVVAVILGAIGGRMSATQTAAVPELPAERVTGIGGVFFKAKDPKALVAWYRHHLGIAVGGPAPVGPAFAWRERDDPSQLGTTTWAIFREETTYFAPSKAPFMLNYRVRNLDRMVAQLRGRGIEVEPKIVDDAAGRFAWLLDPEGNRIELWEPKAGH